jgi:predicted kinase/RimJ/RimL family protein N-acetyltransferase
MEDTLEGGIVGEAVSLVPATEEHLSLLAGWFADPAFVRHWGGRPLSREEVAAKYIGRRAPAVVSLLILRGADPVGYAQYVTAGPREGGIDMVLLPHAQGQGLGPDAARALVRYLHSVVGWDRVTVDPEASNHRAVGAWSKAGFRPVGPRGSQLLMECGTGPIRVARGLVVLVGPPASGKSSFVRALIARGRLDEDAVVSSDEIRAELFGTSSADATTDEADARIFGERDRRIVALLAGGRTAVAESTNVTPQARTRLIALARRFDAPVTILRFDPDLGALLEQHAERDRTDVTTADVHASAAVMARHAGAGQLRSEGAHAVHDVPGRRQRVTPAEAAARFTFT